MTVPNIPGLENINVAGAFAKMMIWIAYFVISAVIIAVMAVGYYLLTFNIKVQEIQLRGGTEGNYSIDKPKWNRAKSIKNGTAWKPLFPLFNKKEYDPFPDKYIYAGNKVFAFKLGGQWLPGSLNISEEEGKLIGEINPVPEHFRNWQSLQHKKNAIEFAEHNWWEDNKYIVYGLIAIGLSLALCGITIYFTYQFVGGESQSIDRLTKTIADFGQIKGIAPG